MPDIRPPRERIETKRDAVEELAWHYRHRLRRLLAGIPEIWGAWFFGMHITTGNSGPDLVRVEKSEHPLRLEVKAASQAIVLDLDQIERYARTPDTFFLLFFHGAQQPLSRLEELFAPAAEDGGAEDVYAHAMRSIADAMHEDSSLYLLPASLMRPLYDSLSTFESQGDRQRGISKKLSRSACEAFLSGMEDSSVRRVALDDTGNSLAVVGGSSTERRFFATGTWSREPVAVRPKKPRRNIYGLPKMEVPKAPDTGMDDLFGRRPKRRKLLSTEKLKTPDDDCPF